jgi:hypothetical protein
MKQDLLQQNRLWALKWGNPVSGWKQLDASGDGFDVEIDCENKSPSWPEKERIYSESKATINSRDTSTPSYTIL